MEEHADGAEVAADQPEEPVLDLREVVQTEIRRRASLTVEAGRKVQFLKEGTEKMYQSNAEVKSLVDKALEEVKQAAPDISVVSALLEDTQSKLAYRQKIIKLADQFGWDTVKAYEMDTELGDDDEDAKRIKHAVAKAEKSRKAAVAVGGKGRGRGYGRQLYQNVFYGGRGYTMQPFRGQGPYRAPHYQQKGSYSKPWQICYNCFKPGHYARDCNQEAVSPPGTSGASQAST